VIQAFFRAQATGVATLAKGVSTDCLHPDEVSELANDIGLDQEQIHQLDLRRLWDRASVAAYHRNLLRQGRVSVAAVSLAASYRDLIAEGLPAFPVRPTSCSIRQALAELLEQIEQRRSAQAQMAAAVVLPILDDLCQFPQAVARVRGLVLDAATAIGVAVHCWVGDALVLSGGQDAIASLTGEGQFALLHRVRDALGLRAVMGLGYGGSVAEAEHRALLALGLPGRTSRRGHPLPGVLPPDRSSPLQAPVGEVTAATAGQLPMLAMQQALEAQRRLGRRRVTAYDLASALQLSVRSARRILLTLSDCGAARFVGEVKGEPRGRPRHVYDLQLHLGQQHRNGLTHTDTYGHR
jgi:hypothetical protein